MYNLNFSYKSQRRIIFTHIIILGAVQFRLLGSQNCSVAHLPFIWWLRRAISLFKRGKEKAIDPTLDTDGGTLNSTSLSKLMWIGQHPNAQQSKSMASCLITYGKEAKPVYKYPYSELLCLCTETKSVLT